MSAPSAVSRFIASIAAFAAGVLFVPFALAQPFIPSSNYCAADRGISSLNCTANDIEIASVTVNNAVTTCRAGDPVTLDLTANLHVNASNRHDIGIFLARDGKSPDVPAASGGSSLCYVFGLPATPNPPFGLIGDNLCNDISSGTQGVAYPVPLGTITVTCSPGPTGNLVIPSVITWDTAETATSCQLPADQWVRPGSPAKCEAGITADIPVTVQGKISITKQTNPDQAAGTFSFSATGTGVTPATFSLSDGQTQNLTTGNLGTTAQAYSVVEDALTGFDPAAQIACVDKLGAPQTNFVSVNSSTRTLTVQMSANPSAGLSEVYCTFTNTKQSSFTIVKNTVGGNGTFAFTGSSSFNVTTTGGTGQTVFSPVAPGTYTVTESVPVGWDLTGLSCSDPTNDTSVSAATATINLAAGENVTCTFTDTARGTIQIAKATTGGDGTFSFSSVPSLSGLSGITTSAGSGGPVTVANLPAGPYAITESVPAGWDLTSIACTDPSGGTTTSLPTANIALAAGETVSCTFNNTRRASITVVKNTTGGDGTFPFSATGGVNFSITTTAGNAQNTTALGAVPPGVAYSITESVPAGWSLQGASCRDAQSSASLGSPIANGVSVTPAAGQSVICTFNDVKLATLRIFKHTEPHAAQPFNFGATGLTPSSFSLADNGINPNVFTYANLAPGSGGTYKVTEVVAAGYVLTAVTCSDVADPDPARRSTVDLATASVTPHLDPGESLDCTFTNTLIQPGTITITKHAIGGDGSFGFTNSGGTGGSLTNPDAFNIATSGANHNGAQPLTGLTAGTYTILENVPAGWDLAAPVSCVVTSGSNTTITQVASGVTIELGTTNVNIDAVACEFTDVKRGSITITKVASPQGLQAFTFATTSNPATTPLPATFDLADSGTPPNSAVFASVVPGTYTVTEGPVADWVLTDIACTGGTNVTTSVSTGLVSIGLQPGENVACTYSNAKNGTITITKNAIGGAGGETFAFTGALAGSILTGQTLTGTFGAGTYSVTESVPSGWQLSNIVCSGGAAFTFTGAGGGTDGFELGDTTANISLASGQSAACTFTNIGNGSIRIVKRAFGGDGTFGFTGARSFQIATNGGIGEDTGTFATVKAGTYAVTESVPANWRLTGLSCSNGSAVDIAAATANVAVAPGESVTCTFEDTRIGTITITKRIVSDDPMTATFSVPVSLDASGSFTLTPVITSRALGEASRSFTDVLPGTYTITELAPPAGWVNTGVTCTDPSGDTVVDAVGRSATVQLGSNEGVHCIFTNVSLSSIRINVVSVGGTGYFGFSTPGLGPDYLEATTSAGTPNGRSFNNLLPGTYPVTGLGSAGWQLFAIQCTGEEEGATYWTITGPTATIGVPHGEDITCTFYYRRLALAGPGGPEEIPTLSEWAMIVMATLLALTAVVTLRRREAGRRASGR